MAFSRPRLSDLVQDHPEDSTCTSRRCMFCCTEKRLQSFYEISAGDHLKQPGENFSFNLSKKLFRLYDHHMIVKKIHGVSPDGSSAIVTLIEFINSPFDTAAKVQERTVMKHLYFDEIYVIRYRHETYSPEVIIQRGLRLTQKPLEYHPLFCNCEHVARWCVCGNGTSIQVENFLAPISWLSRFLDSYVRWLSNLIGSMCFLIVIIQQHIRSKGDICEGCYRRFKREIWCKFAVLITLQFGGLVISSLISSSGLRVLFGVLMRVPTIPVVELVLKIMKKLNSPLGGSKEFVVSFKNISEGDVISWKNYLSPFYHDGIVTGCMFRRGREKEACLSVIHYAMPGIFTTGKIVEEIIQLDLDCDQVRLHDYTSYEINEPKVVVERARKRLGETKFGLTNRSAHFCHWAKLKDEKDFEMNSDNVQSSILTYVRDAEIGSDDCRLSPIITDHRRIRPIFQSKTCQSLPITRPFTSVELGKVRVKIREDIEAGHLVQFRYRLLPHQGVCTAVRPGDKQSVVTLDVVHYGESKQVSEETFVFNLNEDDITVVKVHPLYKFSNKDIIRRAKSKVGQHGYNLFFYRSCHLAEEIVNKPKDQRIFSFSEVKPGDCIEYTSLWVY